MNLSPIDYKLLLELDKDSRQAYTALGKKLRTSPQRVKYRVESLIRKRLIKFLFALVEYKKLGYTNHIIYFRLHNLTPKKEMELVTYLKQHPNINVIVRFNSRFDMAISILTKSIFDLSKILNKINNKFGNLIRDKVTGTHIGAFRFERDYLTGEKPGLKDIPITGKKVAYTEVSDFDKKLLSLLCDNARVSIVELSQKLGGSVDTIKHHIKKLKQDKTLLGYTMLIDPHKINLSYYRLLLKLKNINEVKEKEIVNYCQANPNIVYYVKTFGNWEATIDVEIEHFKSRALLTDILNKFSEFIQDYELLEVESIEKFRTLPIFR